ncbi:MAG: Hint domain-containing protein [Sulfitobacter sp.]
MAVLSIYDVNDITIIDVSTNAPPANNPLTADEAGNALQWYMAWPYAGFDITLGTSTVDVDFNDNDGVLSDDPVSGATLVDQQLASDLTIAGQTFIANTETTLWQTPAPVFVQNEYEVTVFDADLNEYTMVVVSIGEGYDFTIVGVTFEGDAPPAGSTVRYDYYNSTITNNTSSAIPAAPCFVKGTFIETKTGAVKVEDLRQGDLVKTRDNGFRKIAWIGNRSFDLLRHAGHLRPIVIRRNSLGPNIPDQDIRVSPAHRILLQSPRAEIFFGAKEVLIAAKHLVNGTEILVDMSARTVKYYHVMFEQHEIVVTSMMESESFHPGQVGVDAFDEGARAEIFEIFPELKKFGLVHYGSTARKVLKGYEAMVLRAEHRELCPH